MSEAKHTPGPWGWLRANDNQTGLNPYTICVPSGLPVAEVVRPDQRIGGDESANAALIAAAPDAHAILTALAEWYYTGSTGPVKHALYDDERTWEQVLAAYFAKVKGA